MEPNKKSDIIKIVIISVAILLAVLIFIFISYPIVQNIQTINQQINTKRQEETALKQRLVNLKELEVNYNKAKKEAEPTVVLALPTEKQIPEILVQLQNIATASGMTFTEISPGNQNVASNTKNNNTNTTNQNSSQSSQTTSKSQGGLYEEMPLTVKILGGFNGLKNYLIGVQNNLRILDISAISIEKISAEQALNISMTMKAYFQIPK